MQKIWAKYAHIPEEISFNNMQKESPEYALIYARYAQKSFSEDTFATTNEKSFFNQV